MQLDLLRAVIARRGALSSYVAFSRQFPKIVMPVRNKGFLLSSFTLTNDIVDCSGFDICTLYMVRVSRCSSLTCTPGSTHVAAAVLF